MMPPWLDMPPLWSARSPHQGNDSLKVQSSARS